MPGAHASLHHVGDWSGQNPVRAETHLVQVNFTRLTGRQPDQRGGCGMLTRASSWAAQPKPAGRLPAWRGHDHLGFVRSGDPGRKTIQLKAVGRLLRPQHGSGEMPAAGGQVRDADRRKRLPCNECRQQLGLERLVLAVGDSQTSAGPLGNDEGRGQAGRPQSQVARARCQRLSTLARMVPGQKPLEHAACPHSRSCSPGQASFDRHRRPARPVGRRASRVLQHQDW